MSEVVKLERHDVIAIVTVNNPPVNALSAAVRRGIFESVKSAAADPEVQAIVLTCAGRTFIAGADITEFGKPPQPPGLAEVISGLENCSKPTIAGIHGTALGGGLEVALGCHFRVATKDARLGLPEVKLGLLPGAGGTQRLPRAVGPELAVKMIVGGDPIGAAEALKQGLIDEIVDEPASGGEAFARKVLAENVRCANCATTTPSSRRPRPTDRSSPTRSRPSPKRRADWKRRLPPPMRSAPPSTCRSTRA